MTRLRLAPVFAVAMFVATGTIILAPYATSALNFGSGPYGACSYDSCSITMSNSSAVSLAITPTASGSCTTQSGTVSVLTDNAGGYTLSLASSSSATALQNGGDTLPATTATQASPAALTANTWGYRVDSLAGFGSGPTTPQSNSALNGTTFASIPSSTDPTRIIATQNTPANPAAQTTVWYGVCANTSIPSGTYTAQITYTAIAN